MLVLQVQGFRMEGIAKNIFPQKMFFIDFGVSLREHVQGRGHNRFAAVAESIL